MAPILVLIFLISPLGVSYAKDDQQAQGRPSDNISLDLKNVDIVELLRIISLKTGKTIVPSKEVSGRITVYLSNVAFNDVLDIIVLTQGLALDRKENVYYVMSEAEYKKNFGRDYVDRRKVEVIKLMYAKPSIIFNALGQLKSEAGKIVVDEATGTMILIDFPDKLQQFKTTVGQLDKPLTTTIFDLNYVKSADAKAQLGTAITQGTGELIVDDRNGKVIISDLPGKMQKLGTLVRELDEESRQVYIEADIVELTLDDKFERGINWQKVWSSGAMDGLALAGIFPVTLPTSLTSAYQRISVGTLTTNKYNAVLNFLGTYGKTNVISQPRIAVVNNEEANIMVGTREAYVTQTQSQATSTTVTSESVEFIDVGVKLKVVPKIGSDGFIIMKLKPEVSSVTRTLTTSLGSVIPIVQTSQSETVVKIKDGMMIMIAGMTKTENTDTINGWPVLSKIPFLGTFFSYRLNEKKRTEVIIFLTPHLSRGDAGLRSGQITKVLPMEYLPSRLQEKVIRDEQIDKTIVDSELTPKDKAAITAGRLAERAAARKKMEDAAKEQAKRLIEDATEKAADKAADKAAKQALKEASIKAEEILRQGSINEVSAEKALSPDKALESAKDYYKKGLQAQADSDTQEAIRNLIKATQLDNRYAAAYNTLGVIYEQESKFQKAKEMYLKAISVDPNFSPAYSNLALFNEDRGDFAKALEYWRKRVLYGDPNDQWTKQALQRIKELGQ